jgi:hypothetical protein
MAHNITINEETLERFITNSPTLIQVLTQPLATPAMIHIAFVKGRIYFSQTKPSMTVRELMFVFGQR